jgi:ATP-binding cassette subfamily B multidrug efflux pump
VQQVQMLVLMTCTMMVAAPIMMVGGVLMAMREDIGLSWLLAVCVPLLFATVGFIISRMVPGFRLMQTRIDGVNRILREQITGIRVVRAFVREPYETARFEKASGELTESQTLVGQRFAMMFPIVMLVFNASTVAVLWFGSHRVSEGSLQIGAMTAFLSYLMQILVAVMITTFMSIMIPRAAVCADRIGEVLETQSSVVPPRAPVTPAVHGDVAFENVELRYPGAELPVLSGVTFTAKPGTTTAIIGGTGSGKTTLLDLIPRLMDATDGTVRVDGSNVRDIEPEELWARIGMVPQRPYLFSGTIATNLRYGKPDATDDELWAALELAQAKDFVEAMPDKLAAPIAQGGTNVSGGQRQRLSIARALLRKPAIYLFDDSFSALDLATEARLRAALKPHVTNATVILVAQRIASILDADQIIVLDAGKIVGVGTHEELLAGNATYQEIVSSQLQIAEAA